MKEECQPLLTLEPAVRFVPKSPKPRTKLNSGLGPTPIISDQSSSLLGSRWSFLWRRHRPLPSPSPSISDDGESPWRASGRGSLAGRLRIRLQLPTRQRQPTLMESRRKYAALAQRRRVFETRALLPRGRNTPSASRSLKNTSSACVRKVLTYDV